MNGTPEPERHTVHVGELFAYVVTLRRRLLDALGAVSPELLQRDLGANHRSILRTLIHIMAVQDSWLNEDILGHPSQNVETFLQRYLGGHESMAAARRGWEDLTRQMTDYLASNPDLQREVQLPPSRVSVTVEQIFFHIITEEMIHVGEILAMTRQLGIDLPAYFLLDVMETPGRAWKRRVAEAGRGR